LNAVERQKKRLEITYVEIKSMTVMGTKGGPMENLAAKHLRDR